MLCDVWHTVGYTPVSGDSCGCRQAGLVVSCSTRSSTGSPFIDSIYHALPGARLRPSTRCRNETSSTERRIYRSHYKAVANDAVTRISAVIVARCCPMPSVVPLICVGFCFARHLPNDLLSQLISERLTYGRGSSSNSFGHHSYIRNLSLSLSLCTQPPDRTKCF